MTYVDLIGWTATAFLLFSATSKEMFRLRVLAIVSCVLWIIYSLILKSYPLVVTNNALLATHLYWILKERSLKEKRQSVVE